MGRPLKIKKSTTKDIGFNNLGSLTNPVYPATLNSSEYLGVVGGANASVATSAYPVVRVQACEIGGTEEAAIIVRQKGTTTYLVLGQTSGNTYQATLAKKRELHTPYGVFTTKASAANALIGRYEFTQLQIASVGGKITNLIKTNPKEWYWVKKT